MLKKKKKPSVIYFRENAAGAGKAAPKGRQRQAHIKHGR